MFDVLARPIRRVNPLGATVRAMYDSRDNVSALIVPGQEGMGASYDDLSRLTTVFTEDDTITYTYDPAGNITGATDSDSAVGFTFDGRDRVISADTLVSGNQPVVSLAGTYDPRGNRTQLSDGLTNTWGYAYDLADRLTQLTTPANDNIGLAYLATGQLATVTHPNEIPVTVTETPSRLR